MNETLYDYILNYEGISNWISSILFTLLQTFEGLNVPFKRTCFMQGRVQEKERVVPADWTLMLPQSHWTGLFHLQHLSDVIIT